jgi:4-amino-4-deoxy-L-arabinose transferase-like glycosyltransferase
MPETRPDRFPPPSALHPPRQMRLAPLGAAMILALAALTLGLGLGRAGRLTYHEAFVAQAAREMLVQGDVLVPTVDGRPWLEKPPLPIWLTALAARLHGRVDESIVRLPSALAGAGLALLIAAWAARRFGAEVGLLAGLVQATSAWLMVRGRLAEADMLLVLLFTATLLAFDRLREEPDGRSPWRWIFFIGLGLSSLVKGIGFGAVLIVATVMLVLCWDRDRATLRPLTSVRGWVVAGILAFAWPVLVLVRYPSALGLWVLHVSDRLAAQPEHFAGSPWWQYGPAVLLQVLPWTPFALLAAGRSIPRAVDHRGGPDRLLWAWAVAPLVLLSLATAKSAHYAIYALPPWSVWSALTLVRLGVRLRKRGWTSTRVLASARLGFASLGLACGLGFASLGPTFDRRGVEWGFYEDAGRLLHPDEPLALLYDDWDRNPYPTPFGPFPHDLAVRLFYLNHPACWRQGVDALVEWPPAPSPLPFAVIGRERDVPGLRQLGRVETMARGPRLRASASRVDDRTFNLYRVTPSEQARLASVRKARARL